MNNYLSRSMIVLFVICSVLVTLPNCASVKSTSSTVVGQFQSKQRINLSPFAEQLMNLIGDIQFGLNFRKPVYIQPYLETPEIQSIMQKFHLFK